jgi:CRISPR-associated protein Csx16
MGRRVVIVSRHRGAVEWLRRRGIVGPVIEHAEPNDVVGKVVYGVLPFHLAALAKELVMIDTPGIPLGRRGGDLTPEEMDLFGATLTHYLVVRVPQTADERVR